MRASSAFAPLQAPAAPRPAPTVADVLSSAARAIAELQEELDARARRTFTRWSEAGVPPSAWTVSRVDLAVGVDLSARPKARAGIPTELRIAPVSRRLASVRIGVRFLRPDHVVEDLAHDP